MNKARKALGFLPLIFIIVFVLTSCSSLSSVEPAAALLGRLDEAATQLIDNTSDATPVPVVSPRYQAAADGTLAKIYLDANPSVVHIQVARQETDPASNGSEFHALPDFQLPDDSPQAFGEGSGFVWDKEGHIVTNYHVIEGAGRITVVFADNTVVEAELIGADPDSDLAVLKVELPAKKPNPVQIGDSANLQVGELAIAIGNPFGQEGTMTVGIVSALGRLLPVGTDNIFAPRFNIPDIIQTDAAINPGNSGGVLLNDQGELIGVTTAIISAVRASSGIGFAIPSTQVKKVIPALITDGEYQHSFLGISGGTLTAQLAEAMELPVDQRGVLVSSVVPNGPAGDAGLQGNDSQVEIEGFEVGIGGDIIIAINDERLEEMDNLIAYLERYTKVGQSVELTLLRDGQEMTISVDLAARPKPEPIAQVEEEPTDEESESPELREAWLGITAAPLSPEIIKEMDLPSDQGGLVIQQVEADSPAAEAGLLGGYLPLLIDSTMILAGGDLIVAIEGTELTETEDLFTILDDFAPGDEVSLDLLRDGEQLQISVTLGENAQ